MFVYTCELYLVISFTTSEIQESNLARKKEMKKKKEKKI